MVDGMTGVRRDEETCMSWLLFLCMYLDDSTFISTRNHIFFVRSPSPDTCRYRSTKTLVFAVDGKSRAAPPKHANTRRPRRRKLKGSPAKHNKTKTSTTDTLGASHRRHSSDRVRLQSRHAVAHKQLIYLIAIVRPAR